MDKPFLKIVTVVGARPQFIKAAAVSRAIARHNAEAAANPRIEEIIVHTGQHYDANMSAVFFEELNIPEPRYNLGVGSGTHGRQTGLMLERIEEALTSEVPDWVLVYGDTNSTLAGALAAVKLHIPVAHVEAGLRAFDRTIPEEVNRLVADGVSSLLLCPTRLAVENLAREGVTRGVHNVGDVMYDSVLFNAVLAEQKSAILKAMGVQPKAYLLATTHRAANTDDTRRLKSIFDALARIDQPIVLPLHPRTRSVMNTEGIRPAAHIKITEPVSYLDMLVLEKNARAILTDSGGMQKEAYFFKVPCVTMLEKTEWAELVQVGANFLAGSDPGGILEGAAWATKWRGPTDSEPLYGDGNAGAAVVRLLAEEQEHMPRPVADPHGRVGGRS
jgi:UDP-GlcNAc3NAcA epimerase